jgi:NADH:ubiquinone oxidoreductase subunit E
MQGKDAIIKAIEGHLLVKVGDTTHDNKFTLLTANCLGWCHKGPVMLVNDEVFPSVTPEMAIEIIEEFAKKTT